MAVRLSSRVGKGCMASQMSVGGVLSCFFNWDLDFECDFFRPMSEVDGVGSWTGRILECLRLNDGDLGNRTSTVKELFLLFC